MSKRGPIKYYILICIFKKKKWLPEIKKNYSDIPIILVGTKYDLKQKLKSLKKASIEKAPLPLKTSTVWPQMQTKRSFIRSFSANKCRPRDEDVAVLSTSLGREFSLASKSLLHNKLLITSSPTPQQRTTTGSRSMRPLSVISRLSKDELIPYLTSDKNNEITNGEGSDVQSNTRSFKQILMSLNTPPSSTKLTLNEFIKLDSGFIYDKQYIYIHFFVHLHSFER